MDDTNFLLICVDQWPGHLIEAAGRSDIETPTLNRLCASGTRFSRAYSETPICGPARRGLMTGTNARAHGDRRFRPDLRMPDMPTLAGCFRAAGYQTAAIGKLHVFPPRDRIGFDDVKLAEEGRSGLDGFDDYDEYLGEQGHAGEQFMHGMSNNEYSWRPWHLDERHHVTNWTTREACKTIKRRDPTRPAFWHVSYTHPHPPLAPLTEYLDRYRMRDVLPPVESDWSGDADLPYALANMRAYWDRLTPERLTEARRAYYALCTHIDHQIRLIIGTLREENLLENTVIGFIADHGDMLGDHGLYAKRAMLEGSVGIPMILLDRPDGDRFAAGAVDTRLAGLQDIMPTLLDMAGIEIPESCCGESLAGPAQRDHLYCEAMEGAGAMRMVTDATHKLIWYPAGNRVQLFDLANDPNETRDLSADPACAEIRAALERRLLGELYGEDLSWVSDGTLIGCPAPERAAMDNRGLTGQRGLQFPPVKPLDPSVVIEPGAKAG
ncbi:sulfatase-like hydrolase/transferase [Salipiger abyssi]|uniref:sulfatase-like hydrolase/transferase n=1 Tax=Salipiger abyssi TaxID=1250539 RepID=UPI001A8C264D|nr:sulfatase-like hydrolase/transferase [Salipiger abyssi]MBN9887056.1 sulfatase-like hydrolase/transferase [Salipiger abyssi]